jgi:hypothetical protein
MFDIPIRYSEIFVIAMYFAPALISLTVLFFVKRKIIWLSIPITIIADLVAFWSGLVYYETRGIVLVFLIPQIIVVSIISVTITLIHRRRTKLSAQV